MLGIIILYKLQKNRFTKQIPWLVFLQKVTRSWQQHDKENHLAELFILITKLLQMKTFQGIIL